MRYYEFKLLIAEGSDEFWEGLKGSGCEEVTQLLEEALLDIGIEVNSPEGNNKLTLTHYYNKLTD